MNSLLDAILACDLMKEWPERVYVKDSGRRFLAANKETLRAAGMLDESFLIGLTDQDLFDGPHAEAARRAELLLLSPDGPYNLTENELETWPGNRMNFVRTIRTVIRDENGQRVGLLGKTCELTVAEREGFLRHQVADKMNLPQAPSEPVESQDAGFWWRNVSKPGGKSSYSTSFLQFFGARPRHHSVMQMLQHVHPEDHARLKHFLRAVMKARTVKRGSMAFRYLRPEGVYSWVQADAYLISVGQDSHVVVTHRVIAEPDMMTLLSQVLRDDFPAGVFVKDSEHRIRFVNDRMLEILDRSLEEVINKTDRQMGFDEAACESFRRGDDAILKEEARSYVAFPERLSTRVHTGVLNKRSYVTIKMPVGRHMLGPTMVHADSEGKNRLVLGITADASETYAIFQHSVFRLLLTAAHKSAAYVKHWNKHKSAFTYVDVNAEFCELCGRPREEVIGFTAHEVWSTTNQELIAEMDRQDNEVWLGRNLQRHIRKTRLPGGRGLQWRSTDKLLLCDETGRAMAIWGISRELNEPRGEGQTMKPVAVIFCDIRRFSDLANQLRNSQDVLFDLLNDFYVLLMRLRHMHGCDFVKYLGDGAMIAVGGHLNEGESGPSAAERAALYALDLVEQFNSIIASWQERHFDRLTVVLPVRLGVGIHHDVAYFGELNADSNESEYSVFGSMVADAQRYESAAAKGPDDILISGNVRVELLKTDANRERFSYGERRRYPAKGCEVLAYALRRAGRKSAPEA